MFSVPAVGGAGSGPGGSGAIGALFQKGFLSVTGPATVPAGEPASFTATPFSGSVASSTWDFGDGSATATSPSHAYATSGTYTVTATATMATSGVTVTGTTTISVGPPVLTGVSVSPGSTSVHPTTTKSLTATGDYSDGSTADITGQVTWSTSDPSIATVDSSGVVTGVSLGKATITATSISVPTLHASATVKVKVGPLGVLTITPASATTAVGVAQTYQVEGFDRFGDDLGDVTASAVLTITPDGSCTVGSCTAAAAGRHKVVATLDGHTAKATLKATA
jgi:hypothetical protein